MSKYTKIVLGLILLIIILVGGWKFPDSLSFFGLGSRDLLPFYYQTFETEYNKSTKAVEAYHIKFYQVNGNLSMADKKIGEIRTPVSESMGFSSTKTPGVLFMRGRSLAADSSVYKYDVLSGKKELFISEPAGRRIGDVKEFDNNTYAFTTTKKETGDSVDWAVGQKDVKLTFVEADIESFYHIATSTGTYSSFKIDGYNKKTGIVYLTNGGGEGGAAWLTTYSLDLNSSQVKQLASSWHEWNDYPAAIVKGTEFGEINESGTKAVYVYHPYEIIRPGEKLEPWIDDKTFIPQLVLRDLKSNSTTTIYKESEPHYLGLPHLYRFIMGVKWLDDKTVIFATGGGVYTLDINSRQVKLVYSFEDVNSLEAINARRLAPEILEYPYLFLSGGIVVNLETNRVLDVWPEDVDNINYSSIRRLIK